VTVGIMQPYFLPYIGYWQLLAACDRFVLYDNIEYTKKGWINRNRFLQHGEPAYFTISLKNESDYLNVAQRSIADGFDRAKMLRQFAEAYRRAPQFAAVYPIVERIVLAPMTNLFEYLHHSIQVTAEFLEIRTPIVISSTVPIDHGLRGQDKVLAICGALGADRYLNSIGGMALYSRDAFRAKGITLGFLQPRPISYPQFGGAFVPSLSILDVLMFNSRDRVRMMLSEFDVA
jgi:hypothetical protein